MDWNVLTIWLFFDKTLEDTSDAYPADEKLLSPITQNPIPAKTDLGG